jgi:hypothetical protein
VAKNQLLFAKMLLQQGASPFAENNVRAGTRACATPQHARARLARLPARAPAARSRAVARRTRARP